MSSKNTRRGFTLIELLVAVLIIGILAAVAVPQYKKAILKSQFIKTIIFAKAIQDAEQVYFLEQGDYTTDLEQLNISLPGCSPLLQSLSRSDYYCTGLESEIHIHNNNNIAQSVYVYLNVPGKGVLFSEYLFPKPTKKCGASFPMGKDICLSIGGRWQADSGTTSWYVLP